MSFRSSSCPTTSDRRIAAGSALLLMLLTLRATGQDRLADSLFVPDPADAGRDQRLVIERLEWLHDHPYDLNTVSRRELEALPGITPEQAGSVITLRMRVGKFTAVDQLQAAGEEGEGLLTALRPYVTVASARTYQAPPVVEARTRTSRDLEARRACSAGEYRGGPEAVYNRVTISPSDGWRAGFLADKDAGEPWGYSFRSGYLAGEGLPAGTAFVLGDYTMEAGQGLVLWRSAALDRGSEVIGVVRRSGLGPQPHRSSDEEQFLRGGAITLQPLQGLHLCAFMSSRRRSATPTETGGVSSLYASGLFRTAAEQRKYGAVSERVAGARITWNGTDWWGAGATVYDARLSPGLDDGRSFAFTGDRCTAGGIDGVVRAGAFSVSWELAHSRSGGTAFVAAAIVEVGLRTRMSALIRDYGPSYQSIHSGGFGQSDETRNERGFYLGIETTPLRGWSVTGFLDLYRRSWATPTLAFPSRGQETFIEVEGKLRDDLGISLRGVGRTTESLEPAVAASGGEARVQMDRTQLSCRLTLNYEPGRLFRLRGRMEWTEVSYPLVFRSEHGYLLYQDLRLTPLGGLAFEGRIVLFQTGSYDTRVYAYENDLRGVYANPPLYGGGLRWYLLVRYQPARWLALSAKVAETRREEGLEGGVEPAERFGLQVDLRL